MLSIERAMLPGAGQAGEPFGEGLKRNIFWMVLLRWVAGGGILLGTIAGTLLGVVVEAVPLLIIGTAVLGWNVWLRLQVGRRAGGRSALSQGAWLMQVVVDLLALTGVVFYSGGVESPVAIFFVFHMLCAGILLSARLSYLVATMATVLFGSVAVLQAAVPSLYHGLAFGFSGQYFSEWSFVGVALFAFATTMYTSVYLTTTISRRLRVSEQQIMQQRDVLRAIISSMSEVVIFLSPEGRPVLWNSSGGGGFVTEDRDSGQAILGEAIPTQLRDYVERVSEAGEAWGGETFWMEVPAGVGGTLRQLRASASGVRDEQGVHLGYVIVAEDQTEQLQLEQSLRTQNNELRELSERLQKHQGEMAQHEKMVAVGTMAAGVAHEIGNPLAGISAIVQLLQRRTEDDKDRGHLESLHEQVDRITKIVRELLEFARPDAGEKLPVDLDEVVEQTVRMVGYSHRARHATIESVRNLELPAVRLESHQFQQVLINILLNALDAVQDRAGRPRIAVERAVEEGWVSVRVTDEGVGMTPDQVRQAFEPFYTTKPPGEGTGLGLAVSYGLVEQQSGRIKIDSEPGEGTTVTVSFPAVGIPQPQGSPGPEDT